MSRAALRRPSRIILTLALASAGACTSLDRIDREIEEVLEIESARLGGGAIATDVRPLSPEEDLSDYQPEYRPGTRNPAASELRYDQAAADRDVAKALEAYAQIDEDALRLDLASALGVFQETGREYITAREEYTLAAIRLLQERHLWGPRFFNDTIASVDSVAGDPDADIPLRIINELRATQRLPYGGDVEASVIWDATEQLRDTATDEYVQATQLVVSGDIPLLRGAGRVVAQDNLIQAERNLVYAARSFERTRRELLVDIASDYFALLNQLDRIRNQIRSIESRRQSVERTRAEVEAGKRRALEIRQQQQNLLSAEDALIGLRESYLRSLDRFKIRLGLPVTTAVIIERSDLLLPEPDVTPTAASLAALAYRLDLQNARDFIDDARRDVLVARNQLLPDLDIAGAISVGTDDTERIGNFDFVWDRPEYSASVTFGLPLDREIERLGLRASIIGLQREQRDYEAFRDNVILSARAARRNIDQLRFSILLNEQRVENIRLQIEEQKLRDDTDPFDLTRSEDELLEAENNLALAQQQLRTAVLEYLLSTGQLRVDLQGRFQPLPGMEDPPLPGDTDIDPTEGEAAAPVQPDPTEAVPEALEDEPDGVGGLEPEPEPRGIPGAASE
jgi:outer membrane protein TolC